MARLNIYKNVFENECESYEYDFTKTLQENVDSWSGDYTDYVECYDPSTGKTFFAPFLDSEEDCAVIVVNGESVSTEYKVQENDVVNVYYMPLSEKYFNEGSGPGIVIGAFLGAFLLGLATGGAGWAIGIGFLWGGLMGWIVGSGIYEQTNQKNTAIDNTNKTNLSDVRGSSNQSLVNNSYPFVIGKHICAPFIVADPYTEYTGNRGEEAWVRTVYCVGYAPLKLTDLRLGDIMLAYNRKQGASQRRTMIEGKLKGYSQSGDEADTGDILDIWKPNEVEIEILQQHKCATRVSDYFQSRTNIDLSNRPLVPASEMQAAGWDTPDGSISSVLTTGYSNEAGDYNVDVTPIVGDKNSYIILTPEQLSENAYKLINGETIPYDILLADFHGEDAIQQGEDYAVALHDHLAEVQLGEQYVNYGSIYPDKMTQTEINAAALFINDKDISAQAPKVYKGVSFPTNFRNNGVWFTESCPMEFTINLDAANGLYASRSKTTKDDDSNNTTSTTEYSRIPLWYAVQWRFYDEGNSSSDSEGNDYNSWNLVTNWNDNENSPFVQPYNSSAMQEDINKHAGNKLVKKNVIWWDKSAPFSKLTGDTSDESLKYQWTTVPKTNSDIVIAFPYQGVKKEIRLGSEIICSLNDIRSSNPVDDYYIGKIMSDDSEDNMVYCQSEKRLYVDAYNQSSSSRNLIADWMNVWEVFKTDNSSKNFVMYDWFLHFGDTRQTSKNIEVDEVWVMKKYYLGSKTTKQSISGAWIDRQLINFESLCAVNDGKYPEDLSGISQTRIRGKVTLTKEQCKAMLNDNNKINGIEVRVIRVSPSYLNETTTTTQASDKYPKFGSYSYSDMITVSSIVTKSFDRETLEKEDELVPVKIQSEADMKKFTYVAIKAKADNAGNIQGSLDQLTLTAESFSPTWDKEEKKWLPENVHRVEKYWGYVTVNDAQPAVTTPATAPADIDEKFYVYETLDGYKRVVSSNYQNKPDCYDVYTELDDGIAVYLSDRTYRTNDADEIEVSQKDYEEARQSESGFDWYNEHVGSNFNDLIKDIVFSGSGQPEVHNGVNTWYLPDVATRFNDNNVASGFMLAAVGSQNGPVAYGYENINTLSAGDWYEECEAVTDGSTKNDEPISIRMEANGYVTQAQKLEVLLAELAATGRAVYAYDEAGHIQPLMDLPTSYPAGVINEQNIITQANAFSYAENPAGLRIEFDDENDGYNRNSFYCWSDGNSLQNYHGQVENYGFKYITNPKQAWSMGRYLLAVRLQQKEALTIKIGREGRLFPILSMVLLQSDELLIGGGSGRIREFITGIQDGVSKIFGIITDSTFDYTGETEIVGQTTICKQGVSIFQPKETGNARIVQQRLKLPSDPPIEIDGVQYQMKVGTTNILLFKDPLIRANYSMKIGDIAMFGIMEHISERYKVAKIKPESKGQYTVTLYPYNEDIYEYGKELPKFQTYMTMPKSTSPIFNMSEVPDTIAEKAQKDNELIDYSNTVAVIPDVIEFSADKNGITIATDRDKKTVCQQSFDINITCTKNDEPHGFIIGQITVPQGWTYTASASEGKVTFNVPKELYISGGNIEIPVIYDDTITYNGYVDQNGNHIVDEGNDSYDTTLWEEEPTEVLSVIYVSNDGGKNLGIQNAIGEIPQSPNLNDFFVWGGTDNTSYEYCNDGNLKTGRIYKYVGIDTTGERAWYWETDEDPTHCTTAMADVFQVANSVLENNNQFAFDYINNLAANTIFTNFLVANQAFISKLATDIITVGNPLYAATKQKQDGIAQNLGYANYEDMVDKAIEDGTIINGGYLRTSLVDLNTLFAEKIQLKYKHIEGQPDEPGAIYGGKYLPDGTKDYESEYINGVYLDSNGEFRCTNGTFEGDIVSSNYTSGLIKYYVEYMVTGRTPYQAETGMFSTPDKALADVPTDSGVIILWKGIQISNVDGVVLTDLEFYEVEPLNPVVNYYQDSDSPTYVVGGTWTQINWNNGIPNNEKRYIHFKVHDVNSSTDTYYTIRSEFGRDGYILKSDGTTYFSGDMTIDGDQFLSGSMQIGNSKDGLGIHSDNYDNNTCEGFNIAQVGNNSIFKVENLKVKGIEAWKPSNNTYDSLTLSANKVSVNGIFGFTNIIVVNTGSMSGSSIYNKLGEIYDKFGSDYIPGKIHYQYHTLGQSSVTTTVEAYFMRITFSSNIYSVSLYNETGYKEDVTVNSSGVYKDGTGIYYEIDYFNFIIGGY